MTIDEAEKIKTVVENKDYIVQLVNTVAKTMIEAFENLKIEDVNMFQLGYNKAIEDLVNAIKTTDELIMSNCSIAVIESIAEQLKVGVENEYGSGKIRRLSD